MIRVLCAWLIIVLTSAWTDFIYMLIAQFASQTMAPEDVSLFEDLLVDNDSFRTKSKFYESGLYIKRNECTDSQEACSFFLLLKDLHYAYIPYNPYNLKVSKWEDLFYFTPIDRRTALYAISHSLRSLLSGPQQPPALFRLHVRILVTLLSDIHQPMHITTALCRWKRRQIREPQQLTDSHFSDSDPLIQTFLGKRDETPVVLDLGGRDILLKRDERPELNFDDLDEDDESGAYRARLCATNLFELWDSGGCDYSNKPLPPDTDYSSILGAKIETLRKEVDPSDQDDWLPVRPTATSWPGIIKKWIVTMQRNVSKTLYSELMADCVKGRDFELDPYEPSIEYVDFVKKYSKRMIVMAGTRIALILASVASVIRSQRKDLSFFSPPSLLLPQQERGFCPSRPSPLSSTQKLDPQLRGEEEDALQHEEEQVLAYLLYNLQEQQQIRF
eukprot:GDKJ01005811.1.p1 GENE.GDKJ01005811.1~~GDKJ01005811.1.p1  ORF type:complete len:445 (+),score=77.18 GDKJ01005811.1:22-1356(+)